MDNRMAKDKEKTTKYAARRWELKQQYHGYEVKQYIITDVLGGWSADLEAKMELVEERTKHVLKRIQKVVLSHRDNIAGFFKDFVVARNGL